MTGERHTHMIRPATDAREWLRRAVCTHLIRWLSVAPTTISWRFTRTAPATYLGKEVRFAVYSPVESDSLFTHVGLISDHVRDAGRRQSDEETSAD